MRGGSCLQLQPTDNVSVENDSSLLLSFFDPVTEDTVVLHLVFEVGRVAIRDELNALLPHRRPLFVNVLFRDRLKFERLAVGLHDAVLARLHKKLFVVVLGTIIMQAAESQQRCPPGVFRNQIFCSILIAPPRAPFAASQPSGCRSHCRGEATCHGCLL